jgi:hypothetical protein
MKTGPLSLRTSLDLWGYLADKKPPPLTRGGAEGG